MTAAALQNHNPDCLSTSRSAVQQALGGDFAVQDQRGGEHWFIVCRRCRLTWYLPKKAHKWTDDALAILHAHAQGQRP